jgi:hypothetical protein
MDKHESQDETNPNFETRKCIIDLHCLAPLFHTKSHRFFFLSFFWLHPPSVECYLRSCNKLLHFEGWIFIQSSNIWEQHLQIKIVFMKRLRAD